MTKRILIVDDEFGLADIVAEILTESGYDVTIAINGALGLASAHEKAPDLIMLDVMMPIMDGPSMLAALRQDPRFEHVPVIMMTAIREALPKTQPPRHQGVLYKPFSHTAMMNQVRTLLREDESP